MGWQSEPMVTLPSWAPGEGSVALLERVHEPEFPTETESFEDKNPCWWILSALDFFDGKEAREAYYAGL